jgi:hypothetical protein
MTLPILSNQFPVVEVETEQSQLDDAYLRDAIAETLLADIEDWSLKTLSDGHRKHLGASLIGRPCARQLWYIFRWVKSPFSSGRDATSKPVGQLMRLFERGQREESAIIRYLTGIGCKLEFTPDEQHRVSDCGGHFGGSLDNIGTLPEKFGIDDRVLFEFKTANLSEFTKLKKEGVKKHKPDHYAQMSTYGYKTGLRFALYVAVCKNDDEIYLELVKLDWELAKTMIDKASVIVAARHPPPKIAMTATHFSCKWCEFKEVCHFGAAVDKNCRSCKHAVPLEGGKWGCELYGPIPEDIIPQGCPSHEGLQ